MFIYMMMKKMNDLTGLKTGRKYLHLCADDFKKDKKVQVKLKRFWGLFSGKSKEDVQECKGTEKNR